MTARVLSLLLVALVVAAGCAAIPESAPTTAETTTPSATTTTSTSIALSTTTTSPLTTTSTTVTRTTTADYTQAIEDDLEIVNERNATENVTVRIRGPDDRTVFDRTFAIAPGDRRTFNVSYPDRDDQHGDRTYRFVASDGTHTAARRLGTSAEYLVEVILRPDGLEIRVLAV